MSWGDKWDDEVARRKRRKAGPPLPFNPLLIGPVRVSAGAPDEEDDWAEPPAVAAQAETPIPQRPCTVCDECSDGSNLSSSTTTDVGLRIETVSSIGGSISAVVDHG